MTEQLNERNINALAQASRDLNDRVHALNATLAAIRAQNAMQEQRIAALEQTLAIMRVQSMGRGPTT